MPTCGVPRLPTDYGHCHTRSETRRPLPMACLHAWQTSSRDQIWLTLKVSDLRTRGTYLHGPGIGSGAAWAEPLSIERARLASQPRVSTAKAAPLLQCGRLDQSCLFPT